MSCPIVHWAQTKTHISLKVDIIDALDPDVSIDSNVIAFKCYGGDTKTQQLYTFRIDLFETVQKNCEANVLGRYVDLKMKKDIDAWWPRITSQPQKPGWLKVDFDRWQSLETDFEDEEPRSVSKDYPHIANRLHREEFGFSAEPLRNVYLIFYNLFQFVGFLYIFAVLCIQYGRDGPQSFNSVYSVTGNAMKFVQLLQYLEVMHPLFGYTSGSALMPFLQISGRNFILFIMIDAEERMQNKPVVFYLFIVWSMIELVRYPFYISTLVKCKIALLTWLRYTLWIPLYPFGILCESIIVLRNLPYFMETGRFSVTMPNDWNATFDMTVFMRCYLLVLAIPGTFFMMNYMRKARSKNLSKTKTQRDA